KFARSRPRRLLSARPPAPLSIRHENGIVKGRRIPPMRISIAFVISALLSLAAFAQVSPQPPRSTPQNPAAAESGSGAQGRIAIVNTAAFRVGIGEFKSTLEALNKELEPKNNELAS